MKVRTRPITIIEALEDKRLLGAVPCFQDLHSWTNCIVYWKALYGLPMSAAEEKIFCEHTGRSRYAPPEGGYFESACVTGRQRGKDRAGSVIQDYEAMIAPPERDGTEVYALSIAQDARSSLRTPFRYATMPFEVVPSLAQTVKVRRTEPGQTPWTWGAEARGPGAGPDKSRGWPGSAPRRSALTKKGGKSVTPFPPTVQTER